MGTLLLDLHLALRTLLRAPGFLVAALLTLALGIGGTTAIFGKVDQMLLRPLPFPDADRLMLVTECNSRDPEPKDNFSYPDFLDYQREGAHLTSLSAVQHAVLNLTGDGEAEQLRAGRVAWNFFEVLQVPPALGRSFREEEDRPSGARVAILSHGLWQRRFGGDPGILGRSLRVDGEAVEVVGVMPKGFRFPYQIGNAEIFLPLSLPSDVASIRGSHFLGGFGRLRPGVSREQALQGFRAIASRLETSYPENNRDYTAKVRPLKEELVADHRQGLMILMGAVALVLLIACANVANLLLAKAQTRERELAIRMALGADRHRLARLLLVESLVLSLMGGALGLVVAQVSQKGLQQAFYQPFAPSPGMDWRLLVFALLCSVVTALLFGILPALQASGVHIGERLRDGAKGSAGPLQRRLRSALVIGEVALATALLVGAGLLIRSLWNLQRVELGFQAQGLVVAPLSLPRAKYVSAEAQQGFHTAFLERLSRIPGIQAAALTDSLPQAGSTSSSSYSVEGEPQGPPTQTVIHHDVSPDYFKTMGIPLRQGRTFGSQDGQTAVIGLRMAQKHWPGQDPIGKRFSLQGSEGPWIEVIGVAGDVRHHHPGVAPGIECYFPLLGSPRIRRVGFNFSAVLRTTLDPASLRGYLRENLRELDPEVPTSRLRPMEEYLEGNRRESRTMAILFALFAATALLLSAIGIFGVTRFLVAQRTREIGIRMALGANVKDVVGLMVGQGMVSVAFGAGLGMGGAWVLGRLLQHQLQGVAPTDPLTFWIVGLTMLAVAFLACLLPTLRAARVAPTVALRSE